MDPPLSTAFKAVDNWRDMKYRVLVSPYANFVLLTFNEKGYILGELGEQSGESYIHIYEYHPGYHRLIQDIHNNLDGLSHDELQSGLALLFKRETEASPRCNPTDEVLILTEELEREIPKIDLLDIVLLTEEQQRVRGLFQYTKELS